MREARPSSAARPHPPGAGHAGDDAGTPHRTFIAVDLDWRSATALSPCRKLPRPKSGEMVEPDNLHITLLFSARWTNAT
jgi:hypothetical protein